MVSTLFVRSFQGPHGQTHTHKPRKGVRGRRSHRHISHTLTGASLKRCGVRGLSRRGLPFGGPPGIAGPGAGPGRLCTAYRAPRARHRWFTRLSSSWRLFFGLCCRGPLPSSRRAPPPRFLAGLFFTARAFARGAPVGVTILAAVLYHPAQSEDRALVMALVRNFHQTRLKSTCTGGVPCVSRLPPVSFYRRRALVSDRHSKKGFVKKWWESE